LCSPCVLPRPFLAPPRLQISLPNLTVNTQTAGFVGHLSVQHLLDCVSDADSEPPALIDCKGCHGGWPYTGLKHFVASGAFADATYPYAAVNGHACGAEGSVTAGNGSSGDGGDGGAFPVLSDVLYVTARPFRGLYKTPTPPTPCCVPFLSPV